MVRNTSRHTEKWSWESPRLLSIFKYLARLAGIDISDLWMIRKEHKTIEY
jgi:hypothetical protein